MKNKVFLICATILSINIIPANCYASKIIIFQQLIKAYKVHPIREDLENAVNMIESLKYHLLFGVLFCLLSIFIWKKYLKSIFQQITAKAKTLTHTLFIKLKHLIHKTVLAAETYGVSAFFKKIINKTSLILRCILYICAVFWVFYGLFSIKWLYIAVTTLDIDYVRGVFLYLCVLFLLSVPLDTVLKKIWKKYFGENFCVPDSTIDNNSSYQPSPWLPFGRINRRDFICQKLICFVLLCIGAFSYEYRWEWDIGIITIIRTAIGLFALYWGYILLAKRLHDCNITAKWLFLLLAIQLLSLWLDTRAITIPHIASKIYLGTLYIFTLFLFLIKGTPEKNKHEKRPSFLDLYDKINENVISFSIIFLCLAVICIVKSYDSRLQKVNSFRVIDGDTVEISLSYISSIKLMPLGTIYIEYDKKTYEKIRFPNIDCFEIRKIKKAYQQAEWFNTDIETIISIGKASTQKLEILLTKHKDEIYFKRTFFNPNCGWGRLCGNLYVGNLNVRDYMFAEGRCYKWIGDNIHIAKINYDTEPDEETKKYNAIRQEELEEALWDSNKEDYDDIIYEKEETADGYNPPDVGYDEYRINAKYSKY